MIELDQDEVRRCLGSRWRAEQLTRQQVGREARETRSDYKDRFERLSLKLITALRARPCPRVHSYEEVRDQRANRRNPTHGTRSHAFFSHHRSLTRDHRPYGILSHVYPTEDEVSELALSVLAGLAVCRVPGLSWYHEKAIPLLICQVDHVPEDWKFWLGRKAR